MIDTSRKLADVNQISNSSPGPGSVDAAYATLRAFAEQNGLEQPRSTAGLSKLADADSLLDFLRQGGSSAKPSAAPKSGPAAGGTQPSAPVDATIVGAKVCVTCHATQAELFKHTLMGRINQTQKGKFDCENCHGPGSAHVKAGGGRGVAESSHSGQRIHRVRPRRTMPSVSPATSEATGLTGTAARTRRAG